MHLSAIHQFVKNVSMSRQSLPRALAIPVAMLALGIPARAKPKPPCMVYFSVVQVGPSLPNGQAKRLNLRQKRWFERHGNRGNLAGICYDPAKAKFLIRWTGERMEQSSGRLLVQAPSASNDTSASGLLLGIRDGKTLVPLKTLRATALPDGKRLSTRNSASVALLKDGLEAIAKAEKARLKLKESGAPSAL
jgi:hypothetical protein